MNFFTILQSSFTQVPVLYPAYYSTKYHNMTLHVEVNIILQYLISGFANQCYTGSTNSMQKMKVTKLITKHSFTKEIIIKMIEVRILYLKTSNCRVMGIGGHALTVLSGTHVRINVKYKYING